MGGEKERRQSLVTLCLPLLTKHQEGLGHPSCHPLTSH